MANFFSDIAQKFKIIPEMLSQAERLKQAEQPPKKEEAVLTTGNIFQDIADQYKLAKPTGSIAKPGSQLEKVLESSRELGEQVREKIGEPLAEAVIEKAPPVVMKALAIPSKIAGGVAAGTLKPDTGNFFQDIADTFKLSNIEKQPYLGEVIEEKVREAPYIDKIPLVAPIAGFLSEMLLPPYGLGGEAKFAGKLAQTTEKSAVKKILTEGIKDITEQEAENLAIKIAPITNKAIIKSELENFAKIKTGTEYLKPLSSEEIKKLAEDAVIGFEGIGLIARGEKEIAKQVIEKIAQIPKFENTTIYGIKKVLRKALDSDALKKYGNEGEQIFNKIKGAEKFAILKKSEAILRLDKEFKGLSNDTFSKLGDYIEGKLPTPPEAQKSVIAWKSIANDIANIAQKHNIKIKLPDGKKIDFKPKENYYPYVIKEEKLAEILKDQTKYTQFLEQVAEKSKITVAKAHELISDMINGRAGIEGHLEKARLANLPKEFYERDPRKILSKYISDAYDRLGDAIQFGGDDKILQNLIEKSRAKGEDFEEIQNLVNRALGREKFNKDIMKVSQFARTYNNLTKLSLATVTNLGDLTKIFTRNEFIPTIKGIIQSFTKEGKEFAAKAGVTNPVLSQFAKEQGLGEKFFKYSGLKATEEKLRQISANAGKNYVKILYNKLKKNPSNVFAKRRLEQFGLDADELLKRGIKEQDFIEAGYKAIADTQPTSKIDIPYYWQSPTGKILTQYKSFAYKHLQFTKEFIFDEVKRGNVKPLLTFLIIGTAIGEGVGDLKAFVRGGRQRPDTVGRRIIDNLLTVGGLGLATDFLSNLQYGSLGGGFLKFVMGPTLSDIDAWMTAIQGDLSTIASPKKEFVIGEKPKKGESQPKTLKKALYSMPFLGPALSNQLFPTRSEYKAKTIPIAEDILQLMEEQSKTKSKFNF